jgi:hypothetical protein
MTVVNIFILNRAGMPLRVFVDVTGKKEYCKRIEYYTEEGMRYNTHAGYNLW